MQTRGEHSEIASTNRRAAFERTIDLLFSTFGLAGQLLLFVLAIETVKGWF